jgi:16S rRNA (uracil1498-N3)-methyltransferase
MTRRYYVPALPPEAGEFPLPLEEAKHAAAVMRIRPGDVIDVFDGADREGEARVIKASKREVACQLEAVRTVNREAATRVTAWVALPKGDRTRVVVEKLTELGVQRLVPLHCHRSQGKPSASALQKLQRYVIEACKQSGRNRLMEVAPPRTSDEAFDRSVAIPPGETRWFADPTASPEGPSAAEGQVVHFAVGPEGGFSDAERQAATAAGWRGFGLGPRILRVETAAITVAARLLID